MIKEMGMDSFYKTCITVYDWMAIDENVQVNGMVLISDYTDMTMNKFRAFFKPDQMKDFIPWFEVITHTLLKCLHMFFGKSFNMKCDTAYTCLASLTGNQNVRTVIIFNSL